MENLLNADDHKDVVSSLLSHLTLEEIISLGEALGLKKKTIQPMSEMPGDMVEAWLKMKDDVYDQYGEPTWNSLVEGLKKVNQKILAIKVIGHVHHSPGDNFVGSDEPDASYKTSIESDRGRAESKMGAAADVKSPFVSRFMIHGGGEVREKLQDVHKGDFKTEMIRRPTTDRGHHKPQLRLQVEEDHTLEIVPEERNIEPYSRRGFYPMNSERHGVALIISNRDFKWHYSRQGTDRDEYNLSETMQFLGYHVIIQRNCTKHKIVSILSKIDELLKDAHDRENVANDSFVCCILSHGDERVVYGSDSTSLKYIQMQTELGKSEILRSKPKILIIQACQESRKGPKALQENPNSVCSDGDTCSTISEYTDFYLSYASVHGDCSYRDIDKGTWFITEMCCALCKFGTVMDLDEIQKEVNERVVKEYAMDDCKQQPCGVDQLRRKVFFFQK